MIRSVLVAAGCIAGLPVSSPAAECGRASGPGTAALVELYTSQGCSTCPPAERWLSDFRSLPANAAIVPLAFHVNYWDSLGWKDRFADARFTARQRSEVRASGARVLYTPQVMLGGRDLPFWKDRGAFTAAVDRIRERPSRAAITLVPRLAADGQVRAEVVASLDAAIEPGRHELVVALTQHGLSSHVTAGENSGRDLAHDFVVRDIATARLRDRQTSRVVSLRVPERAPAARVSVAAFIQDVASGEVVQAIESPLCP